VVANQRLAGQRPPSLIIPGMIALAFLLVPLVAILADAPWGSFLTIVSSPTALEALRISLIASVSAAGLVFVTGVPLAWILARDVLPGTRFWRALVIVPLLLPPVVSGVALLSAFGRRGLKMPRQLMARVLDAFFRASPCLLSLLHSWRALFWPGRGRLVSLEPPLHSRAISKDLPKPCPWRCTRHWSQIVTVQLP
jgi:ABC-type sulfate transport system permease subunit